MTPWQYFSPSFFLPGPPPVSPFPQIFADLYSYGPSSLWAEVIHVSPNQHPGIINSHLTMIQGLICNSLLTL
jgi:hypothetical protein